MIELPSKPAYRQPCNGCGLCCSLEICQIGVMAFPGAVAPCPALKLTPDKTRTYCQIAFTEYSNDMKPMIQAALAIGEGCTMEDEIEEAA